MRVNWNLDYKNRNHISNHYVKNYIKEVYTFRIGLNNTLEIENLKVYTVKVRKIDIELNGIIGYSIG